MRSAFVAAVLLTSACTTLTPTSVDMSDTDEAVAQFVEATRARAQKQEQRNDLSGALRSWKMIDALAPSDASRSAVRRLEAQRQKRIRQLLKAARSAKPRARTTYLKVLALDGNNAEARAWLRDNERERVLQAQTKKNEKNETSRQKQMAATAPTPATDLAPLFTQVADAVSANQLDVAFKHFMAAVGVDEAEARSDRYAKPTAMLSKALTRDARRTERSSLEGALQRWEQAVQVAPNHAGTQRNLQRVARMIANLEKIRGSR